MSSYFWCCKALRRQSTSDTLLWLQQHGVRLIWKPFYIEGKHNSFLSSAESVVWSWRPSQNSGSQTRFSFFKSMFYMFPGTFLSFMCLGMVFWECLLHKHSIHFFWRQKILKTRIIYLALTVNWVFTHQLRSVTSTSLKLLYRMLKECTWKCNWWVKMSITKGYLCPM